MRTSRLVSSRLGRHGHTQYGRCGEDSVKVINRKITSVGRVSGAGAQASAVIIVADYGNSVAARNGASPRWLARHGLMNNASCLSLHALMGTSVFRSSMACASRVVNGAVVSYAFCNRFRSVTRLGGDEGLCPRERCVSCDKGALSQHIQLERRLPVFTCAIRRETRLFLLRYSVEKMRISRKTFRASRKCASPRELVSLRRVERRRVPSPPGTGPGIVSFARTRTRMHAHIHILAHTFVRYLYTNVCTWGYMHVSAHMHVHNT